MRNRQTFLLTVLSSENETSSLCGKLKIISSGKTCTFTSMEELYRIISSEMAEEFIQTLSSGGISWKSTDDASLSS